MTIREAKRWLRFYLMEKRRKISALRRQQMSRALTRHLCKSPYYKRAKSIAVFIGFGTEVNTSFLIENAWAKNKKVFVPVTSHGLDRPYFVALEKTDRLKKTKHGPLEPIEKKGKVNPRIFDLVIVPGLGFDLSRYRLGYGGGVYDRILSKIRKTPSVGLFFSKQKLCRIPNDSHDVALTAIVTEQGLSKTKRDVL